MLQEKTVSRPDPVAIIDGDSFLFTATYDPKNVLTLGEALNKAERTLEWILNTLGYTSYIGYLGGSNSFRKEVYSEYKANRRNKDKPKYFYEVSDFMVNQLGFHRPKDMETDDAVNITRLQIPESIIVSPDKDLLNLEGTHFNLRQGLLVSVNKEEAERLFYKAMIIGDSIDNIKGIHGWGEKTCEKLFADTSKGYRNLVFDSYVQVYGEREGIKEFYKNYICLKILDSYEDFRVPTPSIFNQGLLNGLQMEIGGFK